MPVKITDFPIVGFAAYSGTGKTTLLTQLIPLLKLHKLRLAVIKHAHHDFDIDHPGKDSYELRHAGASQMLISSARRKALISEMDDLEEPALTDLISDLDKSRFDLILVEGFKSEHFAKIELHRTTLGKPFLYESDDDIIALATDQTVSTSKNMALLDLNQPQQIADFIYKTIYQPYHQNNN
jgi:molybdopterin-guanine dinucleotide biosynthesis protein MobB